MARLDDIIIKKDISISKKDIRTGATRVAKGTYRVGRASTLATRRAVHVAGSRGVDFVSMKSPSISSQGEDYSAQAVKYGSTKGITSLRTANRLRRNFKTRNLNNKLTEAIKGGDSSQIKRYERKLNNVNGKTKFSFKQWGSGFVRNKATNMVQSLAKDEGTTSKLVQGGVQTAMYRKQIWWGLKAVVSAPKTLFVMTKVVIGNVIGFLMSLPAIIGAIICSTPILIGSLCICMILLMFFNSEYTGRVMNFSYHEVELEELYDTTLIPDEVLAITQVLGWVAETEEEYARLIPILYGDLSGKRVDRVDFDNMISNVCEIYNPAINSNYTVGMVITDTNIADWKHRYYNWIGSTKESTLTLTEWLDLYPIYRDASDEQKLVMASEEYIEQMKEDCWNALEQNGYNYVNVFLPVSSSYPIFTANIFNDLSSIRMSSPLGFRANPFEEDDYVFHAGTDYATDKGTPLYAPLDSVVVHAEGDCSDNIDEVEDIGLFGAGNSVILRQEFEDQEGNPTYLYVGFFHLEHNSVTVSVGDEIEAGTLIGAVGNSGMSLGSHLHFECFLSSKEYSSFTTSDYKGYVIDEYSLTKDNYWITIDGTMLFEIDVRNWMMSR